MNPGSGLILLALVLAALSGLPTVLLAKHKNSGQRLSFAVILLSTGLGLFGAVSILMEGEGMDWASGLALWVHADRLSAFFLVPLFVVSFAGALFAQGYWKQSEHPENGRKVALFYGWMVTGIGLVFMATHSMVFLVGWELMALSAFFLVTTEDESREVRKAGWIYFVATHVSTLLLFGLFALMRSLSGSYSFSDFPLGLDSGMAAILFLLSLLAFGIKAGLFPVHVWLPPAHASAPGHVSALMSGVLIKVGVYGVVRMLSILPLPPLWWGLLLLGFGVVSGLAGVLFAIGQHDIKRLLAYHSIENIGIIFAGLGVATIGASLHQPVWVVLGMSGALLHVWNHALFKSLLFQGAGSIIHGSGLRDLDSMGGLAKRMPFTSVCFLTGSIAICGLPFLNGFVSELFIYLGLLRLTLYSLPWISVSGLLSMMGLAMMGALALLCFVKVYGMAFLGSPRRFTLHDVHESPRTMIGAMMVLAGFCVTIGLFPVAVVPVLDGVLREWVSYSEVPGLLSLTPVVPLSFLGILTLIPAALGLYWFARMRRENPSAGTWACGYSQIGPSMQYTSSSFALFSVEQFRWLLRPRFEMPVIEGIFPARSSLRSHVVDFVLDHFLLRVFPCLAGLARKARVFQAGQAQLYILYILITLVLLLLLRQL